MQWENLSAHANFITTLQLSCHVITFFSVCTNVEAVICRLSTSFHHIIISRIQPLTPFSLWHFCCESACFWVFWLKFTMRQRRNATAFSSIRCNSRRATKGWLNSFYLHYVINTVAQYATVRTHIWCTCFYLVCFVLFFCQCSLVVVVKKDCNSRSLHSSTNLHTPPVIFISALSEFLKYFHTLVIAWKFAMKSFKFWLFFMLTFVLISSYLRTPIPTHGDTHTKATQVSHVLVPQYKRKIPSGTGSPVWLHPSPHPGMITRMGSGALDFLQHVHSLMPARSPTDKTVPTCSGKSFDPTRISELGGRHT